MRDGTSNGKRRISRALSLGRGEGEVDAVSGDGGDGVRRERERECGVRAIVSQRRVLTQLRVAPGGSNRPLTGRLSYQSL